MDGGRRFGAYLKALREAHRLTLADVERLTSRDREPIRRSFLSRLERGSARISALKLMGLAQLYRVRLSLLAERLELDHELEQLRREGADDWPPMLLLERAREAGRSGQVRRALLLYERVEVRALRRPQEAALQRRARLGVSRALAAGGRWRAARAVLEDLLGERLSATERAWVFFWFARTSLALGQTLIAHAAHLSLKEVPRPWPLEIEASAPSLEGEYLLFEDRFEQAAAAFVSAADAARRGCEHTTQAHCLARLAEIGRRTGRLDHALEWLARAREVAAAHGIGQLIVQAEAEEGRIHLARGRPGLAREAWRRGRDLARKLELQLELFEIYVELWRLARREDNAEEARAWLRNVRRLALFLETVPGAAQDVLPHLRPSSPRWPAAN